MSVLLAESSVRLTRALGELLAERLPGELATVAGALDLHLAEPMQIRTSYMEQTRDALPEISAHVMEQTLEVVDSMGRDVVANRVLISLLLGEGDLKADNESIFGDGVRAYLGAMSQLIQRDLAWYAPAACIYDARQIRYTWEPAIDTIAGTWIQRGRLELLIRQVVNLGAQP